MKTTTKKLDTCQVELSVTLEPEEAKAAVKDVERVFLREAQIPGFRKGKVPLELIRKEFAGGIEAETTRHVFQKYYADAVKKAEIEEVALSDVRDVTCTAEAGGFTAVIDVRPVFKLPTYKGLKISSNDTTVKDETVNDQIARLRAAYATYEDAKEGEAVSDGDFVQIDYSGTVGKKPILEINPEAKVVASGTGFWTQVEEGRFLPEILEAVKGMKVGETKEDVKAKFDKESAPEGLKGAKAVYTVTLKAFRRRVLPTDEQLAEKSKAESYEKLVATVRETMEKHAVADEAARREDEAIDLLMKKVDFAVPPSLVARQCDKMLKDYAERAQYSGIDADYFKENAEKIKKDAGENATRQVRLWYVIDAIAKAEKIEAKEDEVGKKVMEFILANAKK